MNQQRLMLPTGRDAAPSKPTYGDTWQGTALNRLIPLLERHGYRVVDGTVDVTGLEVRRGGETFAIKLLTPTTLDLRVVRDDDEVPSDQYPGWSHFSPTDDEPVDPND